MSKIAGEWLWNRRRGGGKEEGKGKGGKEGLKVMTVCNTGSLATSVSTIGG